MHGIPCAYVVTPSGSCARTQHLASLFPTSTSTIRTKPRVARSSTPPVSLQRARAFHPCFILRVGTESSCPGPPGVTGNKQPSNNKSVFSTLPNALVSATFLHRNNPPPPPPKIDGTNCFCYRLFLLVIVIFFWFKTRDS